MQMYGMTGEELGTIGQVNESSTQKLPAWKKDFLAKPSVSVRKGIAWGFDPPCEDTDTLVLTAPSGKFVDLRFPKDARSSQEVTTHSSFWAFTGVAITTFYDAGRERYAVDMPYTAHCQFIHDIDSRGPGITDEGDMFLLANGDCIEMGLMVNPATSQTELYKEYWSGVAALPGLGGADDSSVCAVACVTSPATVKGLLIRIGGRVQGIVCRQNADKTTVVEFERQLRTGQQQTQARESEVDVTGQEWLRDARSNGHMPCQWLSATNRAITDVIDHSGIVWEVLEVTTQV